MPTRVSYRSISDTARRLAFGMMAVLAIISAVPFQTVFAGNPLPPDEIKALGEWPNWVPNPCDGGATVVATPTGTLIPDDQIPGKDNREKIWNYLIALGLTPVQAAGIEGNIGREGVYDPTNIEDPAGTTKDWGTLLTLTGQNQGYGLIGFTPGRSLAKGDTSGADWSGISKVDVNKDNFYYISTQLAVVYGYMKNSKAPDGKNMLEEYQNKSTSPGDAALAFEDLVENPGVLASDERVQYAIDAMNDFSGKPAVSIGAGGSPGSVPGGDTCGGCTSGDGGGATLSGDSAGAQVFNYFIGKHLDNDAAAAATGNLDIESAGFTVIDGYGGGGGAYYGIAQWSPSRRASLVDFAGSEKNAAQLSYQLDFIWHELTTESSYAPTLHSLRSHDSLESKVHEWGYNYEGALNPDGTVQLEDRRQTSAKDWLHKATAGGISASPAGGAAGGATGAGCSGSVDTYKNPFRDIHNLRPERIDMGVDYAGSGPVYALGSGTVKNLINSGWNYGGYDAFISVLLDSGPAAGKYSYMAEACVPVDSLHVGQHVDADTVICNMINPSDTGIETGWGAAPGTGETMAISEGGGYTEGYATEFGENYNDLLVKLGTPSGTQQPRMGSIPSDWPTWK